MKQIADKACGFALLAAVGAMLVGGCASVEPYYTAIPSDAALADYEGELKANLVQGKDAEGLILARAAEDYLLVGRADFHAPAYDDWTGAMVRKGRAIKAEKVDYFTWYLDTQTESGIMTVPTTQTSTGTVWGPRGPRTVVTTTTGTTLVPYQYNFSRNEYHVFYFKKTKSPSAFGIFTAYPDDEFARKLGTRKAIVVTGVVPNKLAWRNDLFKGDVILEIDGLVATAESVRALDANAVGKSLKIWRDGKEISKVIEK